MNVADGQEQPPAEQEPCRTPDIAATQSRSGCSRTSGRGDRFPRSVRAIRVQENTPPPPQRRRGSKPKDRKATREEALYVHHLPGLGTSQSDYSQPSRNPQPLPG